MLKSSQVMYLFYDDVSNTVTQSKSQWEMETVMLHKLADNVTSERNQLLISYNILTTKQDQLQTSYNNLVKERDQLQKRLEDLTTNRDDLQRKLQGNYFLMLDGRFISNSNFKSRQDCLQKGSDLMIINSREEQVCNFVNQFKKRLWIGLTDSETDGTWKWVDGTRMNTSYWNNGEPNGGKNENCGHIDTYNSENSWNDARCSILHFWICEKSVSP
uniref:C-type lectin domain-containing protein n=1 Tax=Oreochromis aureus TaxID=47969 RepID=A0A668U9B8_OREAU